MFSHKLTTLSCCFIIFFQFCVAQNHCPPSSCGNIPNISFPFKLTNDPPNCGDPRYELSSENNTTLAIYFNDYEYKYIVRAINYANQTLRLTYPSILQNNNSCYLPNQSTSNPFYRYRGFDRIGIYSTTAEMITFISCPPPVNHSSFLLEVDDSCGHTNIADEKGILYVKVGNLNGSYIKDNCTIALELLATSMPAVGNRSSVSISEMGLNFHGSDIHFSLFMGDVGLFFGRFPTAVFPAVCQIGSSIVLAGLFRCSSNLQLLWPLF